MSNFQEWCVRVLPFIQAAASGEVVQASCDNGNHWVDLSTVPLYDPALAFDFDGYDYRIKPRTIMIGDIEVPEPMSGRPNSGNWYYMLTDNPYLPPIVCHLWVGDLSDFRRAKSGLCHDSFFAAALHHQALTVPTTKKDASHE